MARPKSRNIGHKNRNHQFFEGLGGLKRGLDHVIRSTTRVSGGNSGDPDRMLTAEQRRARRALKRLRDSGQISTQEYQRRLHEQG